MSINKIKLNNPKSVSFSVRTFCPPVKKARTLKHVIHPSVNVGFTVRPYGLRSSKHGLCRLTMPSSVGPDTVVMRTLSTIDGSPVKRVFCYSTRQGSTFTTAVLSVTENGAYYTPLFGGFSTSPLPGGFNNADCFEAGYTRGRHYVFAINQGALYAATNALSFAPIAFDGSALSMKVLGGRLFVLDSDARTIHFSAPLDMLDFHAETGLAGSVQADESLGSILELSEFEGKLLLVHRNGFSTLEPAYDPQKFTVKPLGNCYEEIIPNTAKTLGSTIYFLTKEGMCVLEGGRARLLDIDVGLAPSQVAAASIVYDNRYYLAFRSRSDEGSEEIKNDTVLVIEKFFDSWTLIKDVCVRDFELIWNQHAARLGVLTDSQADVWQLDYPDSTAEPLPSKWESDWFALTYAATVQFIKQVLIKTLHPITLVVANNRGEQRMKLNGSAEVQKINLNMKGEMFKIAIESESRTADISALTIVVGFNNRNG